MTYTVNELSKRTGLSIYTIRYYAREGLLLDVPRNGNGVRFFNEYHLILLDTIECLKCCGTSIGEIKEFLLWTAEGDSTLPQRLELFEKQEAALEQKLQKLEQAYAMVRYKRWMYTMANQAGTMQVFEKMGDSDVPEDILALQNKLVEQGHLAATVPVRGTGTKPAGRDGSGL